MLITTCSSYSRKLTSQQVDGHVPPVTRVTLVEKQSRRLPLSGGERCSRRPWRRNICLEAGLFYCIGRQLHRFVDVWPSQLLMSVINKKAYCHQNECCCTTSRSCSNFSIICVRSSAVFFMHTRRMNFSCG